MSTPSGTLAARQRHRSSSTRSATSLYLNMSTKAKIWRCYFLDSQYRLFGMGTVFGRIQSRLSARPVS